MHSNYTLVSHHQLQQKYFYPVQGLQGYWVGTNEMAPRHETIHMLLDRDTSVVYLLDAEGKLYMQPAHMFRRQILNAPQWKTIPLPNVEFRCHLQCATPPSTPPSKSQTVQPHAHQRGYATGIATYTGKESPKWVETRYKKDGQVYSTTPEPRFSISKAQPNGYYYSQHAPTTVAAPKIGKKARFALQ